MHGPIVLRDDDTRLKRHDSMDEALAEARRLAAKERRTFYVYMAVKAAAPKEQPVEVSDLSPPEF